MHRPGMVSIWFFVGALLLIYGVLILGAGLYERAVPPEHVVLSHLGSFGRDAEQARALFRREEGSVRHSGPPK